LSPESGNSLRNKKRGGNRSFLIGQSTSASEKEKGGRRGGKGGVLLCRARRPAIYGPSRKKKKRVKPCMWRSEKMTTEMREARARAQGEKRGEERKGKVFSAMDLCYGSDSFVGARGEEEKEGEGKGEEEGYAGQLNFSFLDRGH